jgi:hypothetical protein
VDVAVGVGEGVSVGSGVTVPSADATCGSPREPIDSAIARTTGESALRRDEKRGPGM